MNNEEFLHSQNLTKLQTVIYDNHNFLFFTRTLNKTIVPMNNKCSHIIKNVNQTIARNELIKSPY